LGIILKNGLISRGLRVEKTTKKEDVAIMNDGNLAIPWPVEIGMTGKNVCPLLLGCHFLRNWKGEF
jgi:hypothetical protein